MWVRHNYKHEQKHNRKQIREHMNHVVIAKHANLKKNLETIMNTIKANHTTIVKSGQKRTKVCHFTLVTLFTSLMTKSN